MIICHCRQVTDRTIRRAAAEGARTVGHVGRHCGAGTCCGGCIGAVREVLETERRALPVALGSIVQTSPLPEAC